MKRLGAEVHLQPAVPFSSPLHYAQLAATIAKERGGYHTNQFENLANYRAHYGSTGPEIWRQSGKNVDVFITSAGTGEFMFFMINFFALFICLRFHSDI